MKQPDYSPPKGALNPQVRQDTIKETIGNVDWLKAIRPSTGYTNRLKVKQIAERGLPGVPEDYQEDHFIPLELGGHPTDPNNLWPERLDVAHHKDKWENYLHRQLLAGKIALASAQKKIADPTTWIYPPPKGT